MKDQVEENTTSIELIKKDLSYMKDGIDDLKEIMRNLKKEITNGFVTKDNFNSLDERVKDLETMKDWAIKLVIGAVIISLLALIGLKQ